MSCSEARGADELEDERCPLLALACPLLAAWCHCSFRPRNTRPGHRDTNTTTVLSAEVRVKLREYSTRLVHYPQRKERWAGPRGAARGSGGIQLTFPKAKLLLMSCNQEDLNDWYQSLSSAIG
ncbi:hypothetical protein EYF80_067932 [Liparis tanakae]|uniref:Uncharacterized protein n=1 Tax=Liparis tanakae TaxID=230148 RepID=A0A4Z2DZK5_9TELE|nr:hypothetical protein EYF80_067932 [Liparis tanakae]